MSSALLLGLVGCNSANNNQQGTPNPTNQNTEVTLTDKTLETTQETEAQYQVYSLEGMSSDELFNLLVSFSTDIKTGDTLDNYADRFAVEPYTSNANGNGNCYWFFGSDGAYYPNGERPENITNYISTVEVWCQREMDNTITLTNNSGVRIRLFLNDYSIASDLYDKLFNYLCQLAPTSYVEDNREGTYWYSSVYYETNENNCTGSSITMEKQNNDFCVSISFPLCSGYNPDTPVETVSTPADIPVVDGQ